MVVAISERASLRQRSSYLRYLPAIYADSDFMGRFLMIFESVLGPIQNVVDNIPYYLDPKLAPQEALPWLASWVDVVLDDSWPVERRRALVSSAVQLYQWRGTRRGMREYLRVYTGVEPEITEEYGGFPLNDNSRLGLNTALGSGQHNVFTVTLELDDPESLNVQHIKTIIEAEKPAHAAYRLEIKRKVS
ncbi:MAG: phage tail protein [Chloroflexi bacterium]|nr:phage tail protein [Chloroflexota bacterium]MCI0840596.1 phage tail protein [Chloroflexota bacterium]